MNTRPNAIAISEVASRGYATVESAIRAFVHHIDESFSHAFAADEVLAKWRELSVHTPGDQIHCVIGERTIRGRWSHIDPAGRAVLDTSEGTISVSAGDLFLA